MRRVKEMTRLEKLFDLYVKMEDGSWHWLGVGRPENKENTANLVSGMDEGTREYMLYLPL